MKTEAPHWTADFAQREVFFNLIASKVAHEAGRAAWFYGVVADRADFASQIRLELLEEIAKGKDFEGPLAMGSPEEAAAMYTSGTYDIRDRSRSIAKSERRRQSRQAELLADIREPEMPMDVESELLRIARGIGRVKAETPALTERDASILGLELLRQIGIDDLPERSFGEAAKAAGTTEDAMRRHIETHSESHHLSTRDRKALSRAKAKVTAKFNKSKFSGLLALVLTLGSASVAGRVQTAAICQFAAVHQSQTAAVHQLAAVHQSQTAAVHQLAAVHQSQTAAIHQLAAVHQSQTAAIHQLAAVHQSQTAAIHQLAAVHQSQTAAIHQLAPFHHA